MKPKQFFLDHSEEDDFGKVLFCRNILKYL